MWKCHCRDCQRSTGGGAAVNVVFSMSAVQFTKGAPKEYVCTGTSGNKTHRGFCAECGSPVSARADLIPEIRGISAASMDDPGRLELVKGAWLVCADSGYKYPVRDGIPVMLVDEGAKWKDVAVEDLPLPPPD